MFGPSMTAAYAVQALVCLADRDEPVRGAEEISARTGVPRPYLTKILHSLAGQGLVGAKRGYRGGYRLGRAPEKITLFDILTAVDGADAFERCLLGLGKCSPKRGCPVHPQWSAQRKRVKKRYRELTLRELARFERFDFERDYRFGCNGKPVAPSEGAGRAGRQV